MPHEKSVKYKNGLNQIVALVATGMLLLSTVFLIQAYRVEHRAKQQAAPVKQQTAFSPSQKIMMGSVEMSVAPVRYSDGENTFKAPAGKHYAIILVTIKNRTDQPINILPTTDTYMKDDSGNVVNLSPFSLTNPFKAGELSPGETIRGELSYLVTKNTTYSFYVDAIWSGSVLKFKIN